jgi:LmbE family N-acetylglucosaminyl deacetylase
LTPKFCGFRLYVSTFVVLILCGSSLYADTNPLPQDTGYVGLYRTLNELRTTARILHVTAHPDDEDGGMLAMEARGKGAAVVLCSLTRGEGGQNKSGSAFSDELGVLRTLELLAASQYYGVDLCFTRVADFGYSKNAQETIEKWGGHDAALRDLVRVIRQFRPDIIIARFSGTPNDGHGNHEASGVLAKEAFRAAADPNRFPEQIKEGLLPWQAKKFYQGGLFRQTSDANLKYDLGFYDPLLGASYAQFGIQGLAHQTSQGAGGARLTPGHRTGYYRLADSALAGVSLGAPEKDFFDGIDTSLASLAVRLGVPQKRAQFVTPGLVDIAAQVDAAFAALSSADTCKAAPPLLKGLQLTNDLIQKVQASVLSDELKADLLAHLNTKAQQFREAANLALGVALDLSVDPPGGNPPSPFPRLEQTFQMATPGQTFTLTARLWNRSEQTVTPQSIKLQLSPEWNVKQLTSDVKPLRKDDVALVQFQVTVPQNAPDTKPYWHRDDPYRESVNQIDYPKFITQPYTPFPVRATAQYTVGNLTGEASAVAQAKYIDPVSGQGHHPLPVGPPFSVQMEGVSYNIPANTKRAIPLVVYVRSNLTKDSDAAEISLQLPSGWQSAPQSQPVRLQGEGDSAPFEFQVTPDGLREGHYPIRAVIKYQGHEYSEGLTMVTRQDLDAFYFYLPASQNVSAINVNLPKALKIGYVMGAGDDIPVVLKQLGLDVEFISSAELAAGDLSRYGTIVLGIRAYDVRSDVRANNRRLLDYVSRGGTLLVQYDQSTGIFNSGHYTPYPMTASGERVSVEEAPVEILAPENKIMQYPNPITAKDFDGWVQERGLYFMSEWDQHYTPLLSSHDPGEEPLKGGLLVTQYGKGTYIYSGYAFFRQLPVGVPGAVRLFVNMLSAGH